MTPLGAYRHRVTLQNPGTEVPDGYGGFTTVAGTLARRIAAAVQPATARSLERVVANTVASTASHLVTIRYRTGVDTTKQLVFHDGLRDRPMAITGIHDTDEKHVELVLECVEAGV